MTKRGERTMSDPNVLNNIRWPGPFDDIPLRVDPQREAEAMGEVEAHRIATVCTTALSRQSRQSYGIAIFCSGARHSSPMQWVATPTCRRPAWRRSQAGLRPRSGSFSSSVSFSSQSFLAAACPERPVDAG